MSINGALKQYFVKCPICEGSEQHKNFAISWERINRTTKSYIPFCRKFQVLTRKCQKTFMVFTVSGVKAVRSYHGVMSSIHVIGT